MLLLSLSMASLIVDSSLAADCAGAGGISVYWGQNGDESEGTLYEACASGNYNIVITEQLLVYDDGRTPVLNLASHNTDPTMLESHIQYCQSQDVKVFLRNGQDVTSRASTQNSVTASSADAAKDLADYLLENFLSDQSGPLGNLALDGIDFADVSDGTNLKWDEVVEAINASTTERRIYLSAAPLCVCPDQSLNKTIQTGKIDYIWVEFFYHDPCIYSDVNATNLLAARDTWSSKISQSLIFMGLPASSKAAEGYIPPGVLTTEILPVIKKASNYGGVMIWDRFYDKASGYSGQIKDSVPKVCRCVCDESVSSNFYGLLQRSLPL